MTGPRAGTGLVALVAALATMAGACGVPQDPHPRAIPAEGVPFGLLDQGSPSSRPPGPGSTEPVSVYFVAAERLVEVTRPVAAPATDGVALQTLLNGPTAEEAGRGIRSALDRTVEVSPRGRSGDVLAVELGESFATIGVADQILAVAQIVYTMTARNGVGAVTFTVGARPVEVPSGDGTLRAMPLRRVDFAPVAPA